jgi:16S rRNA processing protein RimM
MSEDNLVTVGRIVGAFGLKGEMKVEVLTDFPDVRFEPGAKVLMKGDWVEVETARWHQGRLLVKLCGMEDVETVKKLQFNYLQAPAEGRPELEQDEFYLEDLVGLKVRTVDGEALGEVDEVLEMPAHDVLVIGEIMVPVVKEFVKEVDLDAGMITVQLIPGMRPGDE